MVRRTFLNFIATIPAAIDAQRYGLAGVTDDNPFLKIEPKTRAESTVGGINERSSFVFSESVLCDI